MDNYQIQSFTNQLFGNVRSIIDQFGNPWFVASDIAKVLGYRDAANMTRNIIDPRDKGTHLMSTPSGMQQMTIINESGLYNAIFASKLPGALEFKHWVTSEVLPAMRKIGFDRSIQLLQNEVKELRSTNNILTQANAHTGSLSLGLSTTKLEKDIIAFNIITSNLPIEIKMYLLSNDPTRLDSEVDLEGFINNFKQQSGMEDLLI